MNNSKLNAISPIDGRYSSKTSELNKFFSEKALMKYRLVVEIEYFISLCEFDIPELKNFDQSKFELLRKIYLDFSNDDASIIKKIEKTTNHDVKAIEYFLKEKFEDLSLSKYNEYIHFGLTSQDINNTAIPLSLKEMFEEVYYNSIELILSSLEQISNEWKDISMIARTHGQPASPTKLGKEIKVFITRINEQLKLLRDIPIAAKFGGASGNFNAHHVAYKNHNWLQFSKNLIENKFGLKHSYPTTQIEHYDHLAAIFDNLKRINTILIDFSRDIWLYISMDYFKQKIKKGEIGSSAMPHKVNPIDFENSEGNLGYANSIFQHLSEKLPISRLQRDLTDSTVLRNVGVPISHTLIAFKSTIKGINKLIVNESKIKEDLNNNWAVVAEAIQTILRRINYPKPYEALKELTRTNSKIDKNSIKKFINSLDISEEIKSELKNITPENFTGIH